MKNPIKYGILTLVAFIFVGGGMATAQTTNYKSYAILVLGIAKNVYWPDYKGDFEIMVVGSPKMYEELAVLSNQKKIEGSDIKITLSDKAEDIGMPRIIYLADSRSSLLNDVVVKIKDQPALIIAEREGLFKKGAGMSFVINENNQLRLDINLTDIERRQLKAPANVIAMLANEKI